MFLKLKIAVTSAHISLAKTNHLAEPNITSYGSASFIGKYYKVDDKGHVCIILIQEGSEELEPLIQSTT